MKLNVPFHLQFMERKTKPIIHQSMYRCMKPFIHSTYLDDLWKCNFPNLLRVRPHHGSPTAVKPKHLYTVSPPLYCYRFTYMQELQLDMVDAIAIKLSAEIPRELCVFFTSVAAECAQLTKPTISNVLEMVRLRLKWAKGHIGVISHYLHMITEYIQQ